MTKSKKAKWLQAAVEALKNAEQMVYARRELQEYLNRSIPLELRVYRPSGKTLVETLEKASALKTVALFPKDRDHQLAERPTFTRYTSHQPAPFAIALSLRSGSYLSHSTAAALHNVSSATNTIYVNKEQAPKRTVTSELSQAGIDRAFANSPRRTTHIFTDGINTYVLLNGKHTEKAGVISIEDQQGPLQVTNLARTLVDLIVRPQYAGGAQEVLNAMRSAVGRVSVDDLKTTLENLGHVYPYHQALGFYTEKAGYPESQVTQLLGPGMSYDFYLEHRTPATAFDAKWRIHYPVQLRW